MLIPTLLSLSACHGGGTEPAVAVATASTPPAASGATGGLTLPAQLGKQLFFDKRLSASGAMSCATCHDPEHFHAPANGLAVQRGGPRGADDGTRATPSLRYKEYTPPYADLFDNPDGISAPGPGGGFAWDGRANTLAEQAKLPLLSPIEMANASAADVVAKVASGPFAALFQRAFPGVAFTDTDRAFSRVLAALQAFQLEDPGFHPYTSKFDLHAGNKLGGDFTAAEARGFKVFISPKTGNCAACHFVGAGANGSSGLFTDFSYEAIGVPRNPAIAANADPGHVDLGLGGPARPDHLPAGGTNTFCGLFKTPTLRNVATRRAFFHNGVIHSLEQALRFYNTRDIMPELWFPTRGGIAKARPDRGFPRYGLVTTQFVGGTVDKYDDLPARFRSNLDAQMPLDGRAPHTAPPMSEGNLADLLCFLDTLTDGYQPPTTPPTAGRCVN
jgi:cytochrome c peroxidase